MQVVPEKQHLRFSSDFYTCTQPFLVISQVGQSVLSNFTFLLVSHFCMQNVTFLFIINPILAKKNSLVAKSFTGSTLCHEDLLIELLDLET